MYVFKKKDSRCACYYYQYLILFIRVASIYEQVEAVFEEIGVKKGESRHCTWLRCMTSRRIVHPLMPYERRKTDIFAQLDKICKPGAFICSNTSALDIDEIATAHRKSLTTVKSAAQRGVQAKTAAVSLCMSRTQLL